MNEIEKAIEDLGIIRDCKSIHSSIFQERYGKSLETAISALEKQLNGGWIPVKKKLPYTNKDILVTLNDGKVVLARYLFADNLNHITAWQPLPPAYKEVENE